MVYTERVNISHRGPAVEEPSVRHAEPTVNQRPTHARLSAERNGSSGETSCCLVRTLVEGVVCAIMLPLTMIIVQ